AQEEAQEAPQAHAAPADEAGQVRLDPPVGTQALDRWLRINALFVSVVIALGTVACTRGQQIRQQALADSSAVTFAAPDGTTLAGRIFGPGNARTGVVFAHMLPADQNSWSDVADYV